MTMRWAKNTHTHTHTHTQCHMWWPNDPISYVWRRSTWNSPIYSPNYELQWNLNARNKVYCILRLLNDGFWNFHGKFVTIIKICDPPPPLKMSFFCNWLLPYDFTSKVNMVLTNWSPVFDSFCIDIGLFGGGWILVVAIFYYFYFWGFFGR
jgi:hypothetical protein